MLDSPPNSRLPDARVVALRLSLRGNNTARLCSLAQKLGTSSGELERTCHLLRASSVMSAMFEDPIQVSWMLRVPASKTQVP